MQFRPAPTERQKILTRVKSATEVEPTALITPVKIVNPGSLTLRENNLVRYKRFPIQVSQAWSTLCSVPSQWLGWYLPKGERTKEIKTDAQSGQRRWCTINKSIGWWKRSNPGSRICRIRQMLFRLIHRVKTSSSRQEKGQRTVIIANKNKIAAKDTRPASTMTWKMACKVFNALRCSKVCCSPRARDCPPSSNK